MSAKDELKRKFSSNPDMHYRVELFDRLGFVRKKCASCNAFFWTLDATRTNCPNPPCEPYGFIGEKITKKKFSYLEAWKATEKFFVKNDHTSVKSYPVVCRWFPGLYFTVASIVAFQRSLNGKTVFEMPANPLIIPQSCMRFNDIPNTGVTGRHFTNFVMVGQHSIYDEKSGEGYWKDRCIDLDFELLTKAFGIDEKEINFLEDVWVGPNAFGYSLEYYVRGLELGNAVFTEFVGTPDAYKIMNKKIIDMGAGLNRFAWLSQGTPTAYDAVFGHVAEELLKLTDYDKDFWLKYAKIAGNFNMEDFHDYRSAKEKAAKMMGISTEQLIEKTAHIEALYSIMDHSKSLLFAISDGGLPSNVGGGYNLRVILRRALGFIDEFKFDIDLLDVCRMHAKRLKPFNPRLKEGLAGLEDILKVESERYKTTKQRGESIVKSMIIRREDFGTEKLIELYESHGITPEIIEKSAQDAKISVEIPTNFYDMLSGKHMKEKVEEVVLINIEGLPPTRLLFYESGAREFDAEVLRIIENKYVALDKTAFYGKAGGQQGDTGFMNNCRVYNTEKYGGVIVHLVDAPNFSVGDNVHGKIDWPHRQQLMKHHTAVHVIHGAAHRILGNHIWQAGANKTAEKAHLDITHYKPLTEKEIEKIEGLANSIVKKSIKINKYVLPREVAEKKYGFTIYQGGAIPQRELRIIEINDFDVEACSGTHCDNTNQMNPIIITSAERIQDGIVRINIVSADAAIAYSQRQKELLCSVMKILSASEENVAEKAGKLFMKWKKLRKEKEKKLEEESGKIVEELEKKFVNNALVAEIEGADLKKLQAVSKALSNDDRIIVLFGVSDKIYVFGSAGKDTNVDIGSIVREACSSLKGGGGGTKGIAQGVGFEKSKLGEVIKKIESVLL